MQDIFPISVIRQDFPILQQKIHAHDYIYFDSAATTQKPQIVIDAISEFYTTHNSNIHRGIHYLSQVSTDLYEQARKKVQQFIGAPKSEEIIFTKGTTDSINLLAYSFGETYISPGDEIIVSAMEHHSNLVPWQMLCKRKQAILKFIPFTAAGELDMEAYKALLSPRTKLVSVVHVSNSLGTVNPIKEIIDIAHAYDIPVCIDGAQSVQHQPINVQELGCDFFVFSGHKLYAPTGIGVLWGKEKWLDAMQPYQGGGDMIRTVSLQKTEYNDLPFKFEAGTTNFVGAYALGVAIDYVQNIGMHKIQAYEHSLLKHAQKALHTIESVKIIGNAAEKSGAISFIVQGAHPADIGMILDKKGIAIRTGTHCTEPIMQQYNIPGTARISFGIYNTIDEIDTCMEVLQKVCAMF